MDRFIWSDEYSVGIRSIDMDHQGLFIEMNDLKDAVEHNRGDRIIGNTIDNLVRYVHDHFEREERMMRVYRYPGYRRHKEAHDKLAGQVYAIQKLYDCDASTVDLDKMVEFLRGWLMRHILGSDMDYAPYLKGTNRFESDPGDDAEEIRGSHKGMKIVRVEVPTEKVDDIIRFASYLAGNGRGTDALAPGPAAAPPLTLDEAKSIADFVLR